MKSYEDFKLAIGKRESSGVYSCVNKLGYLGKYQFGMARLCDLGLTRRKDPLGKGFANGRFEFIRPEGLETFLSSPELQEACFDLHVKLLKDKCLKIAPENLSGAIAACHLLGVGGLTDFIRHKIDDCDEFGTKLSSYYTEFSGYEIP